MRVEPYTHSYPHCWRCGTPLIYWAKPTWFARTSAYKDALLRENETIGWHPEHIKHGRFGDWLENNVDWALSRDRFWGTPDPGVALPRLQARHVRRIGRRARPSWPAAISPTWTCTARSSTTSSSTARTARAGGRGGSSRCWTPGSTRARCRPRRCTTRSRTRTCSSSRFPADFICEAIDQTRGWFYSLLAVNTLVFDQTPYRDVVCLALLLDETGQKMSKSRGNVVDPWSVLQPAGRRRAALELRVRELAVDAEAGVDREHRRDHEPVPADPLEHLFVLRHLRQPRRLDSGRRRRPSAGAGEEHVLDRWIRSRLHGTVREVGDALEAFDALRAAQSLEGLVDDLSNWYVRRSRSRFWNSDDDHAHVVLHECLLTVTQLLAPFCPFVVRRDVPGPRAGPPSPCTSPTGPRSTRPRSIRDLEARDRSWRARSSRSGSRRGPSPSSRSASRCPARSCCSPTAELPGPVQDEIAAALNVKKLESRRESRRTARLLGRAELPPARPEGRQAHAAVEGRARRRRRRDRAARARRRTACS